MVFILKGKVQEHRQWMTRSFAVAIVFLEVRVIGGLGGWEDFDIHANETIVWFCLAFAILSADLVLQWQQLGANDPCCPCADQSPPRLGKTQIIEHRRSGPMLPHR